MLLKRKWRTKLKSVLLSVKFYYLFIAPRPTVSYHCCCASRSEFLPHATFGVWRKKIPRWSAQSSVRKKNTHDNYTNNNSPFFLRQVYMCYDSNPRNWSVPENAELIEKKFQGMPENLFDFFTESLLLRMTRQRRKFGSKIMKTSCRFMIILKSRRVKRREENIFCLSISREDFFALANQEMRRAQIFILPLTFTSIITTTHHTNKITLVKNRNISKISLSFVHLFRNDEKGNIFKGFQINHMRPPLSYYFQTFQLLILICQFL